MTIFVYDGQNVIEEVDATGSLMAHYTYSLGIDESLAMLRGNITSYHQADGLGSVTSLSDSKGSLVSTYEYDSFGNLTTSTGTLSNPFRYTGREFDVETGFYFYRARYYAPNIGRFISEDPIGFVGVTVNLYVYVLNNPVNFIDPYGLWKGIWPGSGPIGIIIETYIKTVQRGNLVRMVRAMMVTGIMKEYLSRIKDIRAIVVQDLTNGFSVFMMIMGIVL